MFLAVRQAIHTLQNTAAASSTPYVATARPENTSNVPNTAYNTYAACCAFVRTNFAGSEEQGVQERSVFKL